MVTFKKYSLQQLRKNYPVLTREELKEWIGGYNYEYSRYGIRVYDDDGNFLRFMSYEYCEDTYGEDWMSEGVSIPMGSGMDPLNISPVCSEDISGSETTMEGYNWYQTERSLLERCSAEQIKMLDELNVRIERVDSLENGAYGRYDPNNKVIQLLPSNQYVGDNEFLSFSEELIHAYQDSVSADLSLKSCIEFQSKITNYIKMVLDTGGMGSCNFVAIEHQDELIAWVQGFTHDFDNTVPIDFSAFQQRVMEFYELFIEYHANDDYGSGVSYSFNYNWRSTFSFMGIRCN